MLCPGNRAYTTEIGTFCHTLRLFVKGFVLFIEGYQQIKIG